ncbi:MAG TPA: 2-oxoacid:ferredoxin oxidoreductase subunit gamma [Chloroflexi bacterium]|nr:2-oxoacid:ferredoxin oxidoreductase subunit gamma [Chloroflexota bacterium]
MPKAEVLLAGLGGQGVQFAGDILARACTSAGMQVSVLPSYGAEARGTLIRTEVVISDQQIVYPGVLEPDIFVAFSQEAYDHFLPLLGSETVVFYDSASVLPAAEGTSAPQYAIPAIESATEIGSAKAANIVMLGAVASASEAVPREALKQILAQGSGRRAETSIKALERGMELAQQGMAG